MFQKLPLFLRSNLLFLRWNSIYDNIHTICGFLFSSCNCNKKGFPFSLFCYQVLKWEQMSWWILLRFDYTHNNFIYSKYLSLESASRIIERDQLLQSFTKYLQAKNLNRSITSPKYLFFFYFSAWCRNTFRMILYCCIKRIYTGYV